MDLRTARDGWQISEVESLLGLGRRDIQRCCYSGRGGVAILEPADTAWGRRTYEARDLAQLFLVRQYRRQGLSLPEVKEAFEKARLSGKTLEDSLAVQASRICEQAEELLGQLLQAQALLAALASDDPAALERVIARQVRARTALTSENPDDREPGTPWLTQLLTSEELLDGPGMALAVDLWLGPGATDALREAAAARHATTTIGESDEDME